MIKREEIAKSVTAVLKQTFPGYNVYADDVREGFSMPALFIELVGSTAAETINVNTNKLTIIVSLFVDTLNSLQAMRFEDAIRSGFGLFLRAGGRAITIDEFQFARAGEKNDIMQASLIMNYFDDSGYKRESFELMRELYMKEV